VIDVLNATTRLEFTLDGHQGAGASHAKVRAIEERSADSREWVTRWFRIPADVRVDQHESSWRIGTVEFVSPPASDAPAASQSWHFVLWNESSSGVNSGQAGSASVGGWAESDTHDRHIAFVPLPSPFPAASPPAGFPMRSAGWSFELDGRTLGAVDLWAAGHVWIRPDVTPEQRQLVAALSAALLLHPVAAVTEAKANQPRSPGLTA
jgi:hypothetical protein